MAAKRQTVANMKKPNKKTRLSNDPKKEEQKKPTKAKKQRNESKENEEDDEEISQKKQPLKKEPARKEPARKEPAKKATGKKISEKKTPIINESIQPNKPNLKELKKPTQQTLKSNTKPTESNQSDIQKAHSIEMNNQIKKYNVLQAQYDTLTNLTVKEGSLNFDSLKAISTQRFESKYIHFKKNLKITRLY